MSSARIDLSSGSGMCSMGGIDRTKPAILNPYLSRAEWNQFCDAIDRVLRPVHFAQMVAMSFFGITFVVFFICIMIQFASFASSDPFEGDTGPPSATLFVIPAVTMVVGIFGMCFFSCRASQASREIEFICRETSNRHSHLSFHVRYERHFYHHPAGMHHHGHPTTTQYIEVSINSNMAEAVAIPMDDPYHGAEPNIPYSSQSGGQQQEERISAVERLQNLETARRYMTQKEYESKRAEILAAM